MVLDPMALGRRLRQARENRRLTQEQAARGIGIPRTALVHIEAGKRSLSTLELSGLANLYHRSPDDFFSEDESSATRGEGSLAIIQRLPPELLDDPEVNRQLYRCVELCSVGVDLESILGRLDPLRLPAYESRSPTRPHEAIRQGERTAGEERRRLGVGQGPIADMLGVITTQGIWASGIEGLPDEISGIFLRHDSTGLIIIVNHDHRRTRKRFSHALQYAHALLDRKSTGVIVSCEANSSELIERRANAFAAAFLMPSEGVGWFLELLEKGGPSRRHRVTYTSADMPVEAEERPAPGSQQITFLDVVALAHHFGVSYPAAVYRLSDLQFVNDDEKTILLEKSDLAKRLLRSSGEFEECKGEDNKDDWGRKPGRELISQIVRLAVEAYRREGVSQGWLRDLGGKLEIPADDLVGLAEASL